MSLLVGSLPDPVFEETSYGIVKRLAVIEDWMCQVRPRAGKLRLRVLDYGCGTGDHITAPLAHRGHNILGVDVHEPSILEARRRHDLPNLSFRKASLDDLLREDRRFDVIICSEVLEHVPDPGQLLAGFRQLLCPGGRLIVTTPNGYGSFEFLCRLQRGLQRAGVHQVLRSLFAIGCQLARRGGGAAAVSRASQVAYGDLSPGFLNCESVHVQFFRVRTLERLFGESGFRVVARRARTLLCGPYVDVLFALCPGRQMLFLLNNRAADILPFSWAADWMFLLEHRNET